MTIPRRRCRWPGSRSALGPTPTGSVATGKPHCPTLGRKRGGSRQEGQYGGQQGDHGGAATAAAGLASPFRSQKAAPLVRPSSRSGYPILYERTRSVPRGRSYGQTMGGGNQGVAAGLAGARRSNTVPKYFLFRSCKGRIRQPCPAASCHHLRPAPVPSVARLPSRGRPPHAPAAACSSRPAACRAAGTGPGFEPEFDLPGLSGEAARLPARTRPPLPRRRHPAAARRRPRRGRCRPSGSRTGPPPPRPGRRGSAAARRGRALAGPGPGPAAENPPDPARALQAA